MSVRQWKRWDVVAQMNAGKLTGPAAAQLTGLSMRHLRRLRRRIGRLGKTALVHGNRGRAPVNKLAGTVQARIVRLRETRYAGFNDRHFAEKLATETPPLVVSPATVRRVLRAAGIRAVQQRRPRQHRKRRDRKAQAGLLLLWDGSRHDWLEGRGPWLCLVGALDDATGALLPGAHFVTQECAAAYLTVVHAIATECGLPWAIYMDQHGALKRNDDHWTLAEELRGAQDPTQVGQALQALGVEAIYALSPQAKGRVERLWRTLQDRLVSELRLAQATTAAEANAVLARYRPQHNARFAIAPRDQAPAWRPVRPGTDLVRVCSFRYDATVLPDNTVRLGGGVVLDVPPGPRRRSYAGTRVEVRQLLTGAWRVYAGTQLLAHAPATTLGELRTVKRRKRGRGAPVSIPDYATYVEATL